jgi:hypothetical protein
VLLAEWSGKGAIEDQQNIGLPFEIGQAHGFTLKILQGKIWCGSV